MLFFSTQLLLPLKLDNANAVANVHISFVSQINNKSIKINIKCCRDPQHRCSKPMLVPSQYQYLNHHVLCTAKNVLMTQVTTSHLLFIQAG